MRAAAGLHPEVRALPDMLPGTGFAGEAARSDQGELVESGAFSMTMSDPIADMLTRIRNACRAGHETVDIPHSRLKAEIARVLKKEGFIREYTTEGRGAKKTLRLYLKYDSGGND